jgi:hypothetical protein
MSRRRARVPLASSGALSHPMTLGSKSFGRWPWFGTRCDLRRRWLRLDIGVAEPLDHVRDLVPEPLAYLEAWVGLRPVLDRIMQNPCDRFVLGTSITVPATMSKFPR